jgi:SLOG cluster2
MSDQRAPVERALANQIVAISVSDSPDLARLGLLERSQRQTVAAIVTRLVRHGARIAYGGNLDKKGYTYQLYPAIAQAYATAAIRSKRPPFVHYVAAYLAQDPREVADHVMAVGGFAEVRLIDRMGEVVGLVGAGKEVVGRHKGREIRLKDRGSVAAFLADVRQRSAGAPTDLDAMRDAMEDEVSARVIIGGRVAGYAGPRPGILHEALLALAKNHALFPLAGFGGAARDAAIALALMPAGEALEHASTGAGYTETLRAIEGFAGKYRDAARASDSWTDLVAVARAEDPEEASRYVLRALLRDAAIRRG